MLKNSGYVYLIGEWGKDNICKIGITKGSLEKRIKSLQTGNSNEIYLISSFETPHPFFIESQLHMKYGIKRQKGEWFELSDENILNFKKDCQEIEDRIALFEGTDFEFKNLK